MKWNFRKPLLAFIAISVIALAVASYSTYRSRQGPAVPAPAEISTEEVPTGGVRLDKVHYTGTRKGRLEWELDAESATHMKDDNIELARLDTVSISFYNETGMAYTLKSEEGNYDGKSGRLDATGDVIVKSHEGYTVSTPSIWYMTGVGQIRSKENVTLRSNAMTINGTGMIMEVDSGVVKILKDVKAEFRHAEF